MWIDNDFLDLAMVDYDVDFVFSSHAFNSIAKVVIFDNIIKSKTHTLFDTVPTRSNARSML